MADVMRERGAVVNSAAQMLSSGNVNLDTMPALILRIINEDMWQQRAIPQRRWELSKKFDTFEEFVSYNPLDGLGTSVQMLKDVCHRDEKALEAIVRATQRDHGGDRKSDSRIKCDNVTLDPVETGNGHTYALRRLRKDRPDLLEQVLAGDMSAHKAMVQAGFRHPTITVRSDNPESVARDIRRFYKTQPDLLRHLIELLQEES